MMMIPTKRNGERTREFTAWVNMKARDIHVCPEWTDDYRAFVRHVGRCPSPRHCLRRIDTKRGYEIGNVRWTTDRRLPTDVVPSRRNGEHTKEHKAWDDMRRRRVPVHEKWRSSYAAFIRHIGPAPSRRHRLSRIDTARGFQPGNVQWARPRKVRKFFA